MTAWVKGLFPARSPGETPRLFSAAEGCNIKALQLNPTPNICHFPLTPKIKGHGTLRFYPVRKNKQRGRFDNYWITLHLVQASTWNSSFSSAESVPSPKRQINRASCSSSVSSFSASLSLSLCRATVLSAWWREYQACGIRSAGLPRLCRLDSKRMWHFSDSRESSQWEACPPLLWPTSTVHSRTH